MAWLPVQLATGQHFLYRVTIAAGLAASAANCDRSSRVPTAFGIVGSGAYGW
jgi:hypothetical protein